MPDGADDWPGDQRPALSQKRENFRRDAVQDRGQGQAAAKKVTPPLQPEMTPELEAEIDRIKTLSIEALQVYERYLMDLASLDDSGKLYRADPKPKN